MKYLARFGFSVVVLAVFAVVALQRGSDAGPISQVTGHLKAGEITLTSGTTYFESYPAWCTRTTLIANQSNKLIAKLPKVTTWTKGSYTAGGNAMAYPTGSPTLRYWYGNPRVTVSEAAGSGKTFTFEIVAKCIEDTKSTDFTADVAISGTTETSDQSAEWTCQDSAYPSAVTIQYDSTSGSTTPYADICFDVMVTRDPCTGAAAELTGTGTEAKCINP